MMSKPHWIHRENKRTRYLLGICLLILSIALLSSNAVRNFFREGPGPGRTSSFFGSNENNSENIRTRKQERGPAAEKKHPFEIIPRAEIKLLKSGIITDDAARALELTDAERLLTQEVIDKHFHMIQAEMAPAVKMTEEDNVTCFFIPALKDRGERQIESFQNDLAAVLREDRAKKALLSLPIDHYYGGLGQFDTYIRVTSRLSLPIEKRSDYDRVEIHYVSPTTGKLMVRIGTTWELASPYFSGLFEYDSD
jgi:hypothetical protein